MDLHFLPSSSRAQGLRRSMDAALWASVSARAKPTDYAAYFDAAQTGPSPNPMPVWPTPRVVTLAPPFFSATEIASLCRWWDTEPLNALCLEPIAADTLAQAQIHVHQALAQLALCAPEMHAELCTTVTDIVMAQSGASRRMVFGGISSFAAWGAICLNQPAHTHWTEYFKQLVHETAHLLLFAMARDQPLVLNDASERHPSALREDKRPIDGIFHAAFVSAREAYALNAWLDWQETQPPEVNTSDDWSRMEQALTSSVLAFWDCCEQLDAHAEFSELGQQILSHTRAYVQETFEVRNTVD
jgi:HEXXH motif-containing protein